jgi:hypothetical protein
MAKRQKGTVKEVSEAELKQKLADGEGTGADRRIAERLDARWEIDVPIVTVEELRRVYTSNISKGGLMFSLEAPATIPANLDLHLTLPGGRTVTLSSEVRHVVRRDGSTEYLVGVQFQPLADDLRGELEAAIAALPK